MIKIKNFVFVLYLFLFFGFSFAQVKVEPIYSSERFQPSDKFHAWCENQLDVIFSLEDAKINLVNAIMEYDGDDIDVLKVLPQWEKENNLAYVVENDKITFSKLKAEWDWLDEVKFSLFFKVNKELENAKLVFSKWSYIVDSKWNMIDIEWNYDFQFMEVPECNPDIVEPNVELLFPTDNENIALDSYFQFRITDQGKWIDVDSITISIAWKSYKLWEIEYEWRDGILTIYPDFWLPFDSKVLVKIYVADNQVYWNANTKTMLYEFKTSNEFYLLSEIDPISLRKLLSDSVEENWSNNKCDIENYDTIFFGQTTGVIVDSWDISPKYSVFAIIWWILFGGLLLCVLSGKLSRKKS